MAYDEGLAQILRDALSHLPGITERRMFGGLCFMLNGNMLCGVHADGGMARVGKEKAAEVLAIDGVRAMDFTGRPMGGMVAFGADVLGDDRRLADILDHALAHVSAMPAK